MPERKPSSVGGFESNSYVDLSLRVVEGEKKEEGEKGQDDGYL